MDSDFHFQSLLGDIGGYASDHEEDKRYLEGIDMNNVLRQSDGAEGALGRRILMRLNRLQSHQLIDDEDDEDELEEEDESDDEDSAEAIGRKLLASIQGAASAATQRVQQQQYASLPPVFVQPQMMMPSSQSSSQPKSFLEMLGAAPVMPSPALQQQNDFMIDDDDDEDDDEIMEDAEEDELLAAWEEQQMNFGRKRRKRGRGGARSHGKGRKKELPDNIQALIGEANLHFINREFKEAIEKLLEVVRLRPSLPDTYHTLALIAEEMGDMQKSLQYQMVAAMLTPKDVDLWKRLAEMSRAQGLLEQAVYCLTRVAKLEKGDSVTNALYDRACLYNQLGQKKKALEGFKAVVDNSPDDYEAIINLVELYNADHQTEDALMLLERTVNRNPSKVDLTLVNMLAELYMGRGKFEAAVALVNRALQGREVVTHVEDLPIDLRVVYGVCKVYLGRLDDAKVIFDDLLSSGVVNTGETAKLMFDIAEAYMAVGEYYSALPLYRLLMLQNDNFNKPAVWLKTADCLKALGEGSEALAWYERVLQLVPSNVEARLSVSEIYKEQGQYDKAIEALGTSHESTVESLRRLMSTDTIMTDEDNNATAASRTPSADNASVNQTNIEDIRIMGKQANMLLESGKYDEFLQIAVPLIQTVLRITQVKQRKREHHGAVYLSKRKKALLEEQDKREEELLKKTRHLKWTWEEAVRALGHTELVEGLILSACKVMCFTKRYAEAFQIIQSMLKKRLIKDDTAVKDLNFMLVGIAFNMGDYLSAYDHCKHAVLTANSESLEKDIGLWNVFNRIITMAGNYTSHSKFMIRQLNKHPHCVPLMIMCANNSSVSGTYRMALGEYFRAYKDYPNEPLVNLCIGVNYLNLVMNRRTANRHLIVIQAFTFLYRYYDLMKGNQESCYNLARAFHQLSINHLAVHYYEKVLAMSGQKSGTVASNDAARLLLGQDADEIVDRPEADETVEDQTIDVDGLEGEEEDRNIIMDLKREAAHNLVLLYRESGNDDLARQILYDYLTI